MMLKRVIQKFLVLAFYMLFFVTTNAQSAIEYYRIGKLNYDSSQYQLAISNFSESILLYPNFDSAYYYRGYCYLQLYEGRQ